MAQQIELEIEGVKARYSLLQEWSPKTIALLWDLLPITSTIYHGRLSGDVALFGVRDERIKDLPPHELPVASIYKGFLVAAVLPDRGLIDVTISYGLAEMRRAGGRAYVTPVGEIDAADAEAFHKVLAGTRKKGERPISARRVS
jgi:hypothetical protein